MTQHDLSPWFQALRTRFTAQYPTHTLVLDQAPHNPGVVLVYIHPGRSVFRSPIAQYTPDELTDAFLAYSTEVMPHETDSQA